VAPEDEDEDEEEAYWKACGGDGDCDGEMTR
jgi:hypothetical protein